MKDTGGPAFPFDGTHAFTGMSLRDYFAARVMQSFITSDRFVTYESCAVDSYAMADAMLKARQSNG
jgi:hypothetical protein